MLRADESALVLLAAGRSSRFGAPDKLEQDLSGLPLGLHAALALAAIPFAARLAIVAGPALPYDEHGFELIANPDRDLGMASSVRLGVARAAALGARSVLVSLADMPRVAAAQVRRLFAASVDERSVVASSDGVHAKPPALFGAGRFDALLALDGDAGARALIRGGRHVVTNPAELVDIDTAAELERLRASLHDPGAPPR